MPPFSLYRFKGDATEQFDWTHEECQVLNPGLCVSVLCVLCVCVHVCVSVCVRVSMCV